MTSINDYTNGGDDTTPNNLQELDALIVGAGFAGVYQLWKLRNEGYNVKLVEAGSDYGGVWFWNRYPGARVDSTVPHYEFSNPVLWEDWTWTQRFPSSAELRKYFAYVADKWDLRKDTQFNSFVSAGTWDDIENKWTVRTKAGDVFKAKYLLLNTGFAAKRHTPDWNGIDRFKGTWVHPSYWPHKEPDLKGKKIAIIGTGSTGVQLAQEISNVAGELVVFQRTPNTALPMGQVEYNRQDQTRPKPNLILNSFTGFNFGFLPRSTFDDTPEKRAETYESLWKVGDFHFWLATYHDMLFSEDANREAYEFWRDKTRARIHDPKLKDILAPMAQPHGFGCKRISLENGYFEIFNEPHVKLVDMTATPIEEITEKGIKTSEKEWEFDFVVCATGYDAITGGLAQIDIRGPSGESLKQKWKDGTSTYLGMSVSGFPNMFFTYGPQAPTALCNGPTCAQFQGDWITGVLNHMKEKGLEKIDPETESEKKWAEEVWKLANKTLLPKTKSWYMGDNIPGKPREPLIYLGGVDTYYKTIDQCAREGYTGFKLG